MHSNSRSGADSGRSSVHHEITMFGALVRVLWVLLLVGTLVSETAPLSLAFEAKFPPLIFYGYEVAKLVAFFGLGFLTPLAWWNYRRLGVAALLAVVITGSVEIGQFLIPGHRPSTFELLVKLFLLLVGFTKGLDVRSYRILSIGRFDIHFSSSHWKTHLMESRTSSLSRVPFSGSSSLETWRPKRFAQCLAVRAIPQ
jgi:hypothetical protein